MNQNDTPVELTKEKKISSVFQKDVHGKFSVELKVMCDPNESRAKDICPMCASQHKKFILKQEIRNTKYIIEWEFECPTCRTPLYVINDKMTYV